MRYLCLIYLDEAKLAAVLAEELVAIVDECMTYSDQLDKAGHYIVSHTSQPVRTAITLRHQNGRLAITDGPFAETKEWPDGFYLIEACDLNQALQITMRIPPERLGCVEMRPAERQE